MKKIILGLALAFNVAIFAQTGAKIVFKDADNTIDYGKVSKDTDSGIRSFEFTNTGDALLTIIMPNRLVVRFHRNLLSRLRQEKREKLM